MLTIELRDPGSISPARFSVASLGPANLGLLNHVNCHLKIQELVPDSKMIPSTTLDAGVVDKQELKEMLTSLIEIAKTEKIHDEDVSMLINSMFKSAGLEDKPIILHSDFQQLMKEFNLDYLTVGLDFKVKVLKNCIFIH